MHPFIKRWVCFVKKQLKLGGSFLTSKYKIIINFSDIFDQESWCQNWWLKKEENSHTCYNGDEPWGHCARWNKSDKKRTNTLTPFNEVPRVAMFIETERKIVVARGWEMREWGGSVSCAWSCSLERWQKALTYSTRLYKILHIYKKDEKSPGDGWWW